MSSTLPRLLVTRIPQQIPGPAVDVLRKRFNVTFWDRPGPIERSALLEMIQDHEALFCFITDKIDSAVINRANKLKVIGSMAVGYDHLDTDFIRSKGIKVGYTPDVLTGATAELTVALLLATSRRLLEANSCLVNGEWGSWDPLWMCGSSLSGSTVGFIGLGRIGSRVLKMLTPFGVSKFLYTGRTKKDDCNEASYVTLDELLSDSDFVIVLCSLNETTKHLLNKTTLGKMKKTAMLINTSRGGVVNQDDLYEALKNGTILAAGLDVMTPEPLPVNHPLIGLKNCVLLPHIGSATLETRSQMAMLTAENIIAGISGKTMPAQLC